MVKLSISEFKSTCLAVLERVRVTGEPILITRHGQLIQRGRIEIKGDVYKWTDQAFEGMREAVLNRHVAAHSRRIELPHNDPADRFIAATAQVYDLSLVTLDSKLLENAELKLFR